MLFNSIEFLFVFLPITYLVFWALLERPGAVRLAGGHRLRVLQLLEPVVHAADAVLDPGQLHRRAGHAALGRSAAPEALPDHPDHGRPAAARVLQVCQLRPRHGARRSLTGSVSRRAPCRISTSSCPIGISFYTFHTISYIVDSYRGVIKPTRNFFEFAAYVSLFSQLVAGPIVRFRQIEQDLENLGHADRTRWLLRGISFFIVGLVEKVVMADSLAAFVDPALAQLPDAVHGRRLARRCWATPSSCTSTSPATARWPSGLGYMFGLRIPQNFNSPYKALDPADFWRRWHISLSTCMRDYLYIPFGGNRGGTLGDVPQPDADDADRRPLAWRGVDVRVLGRLSRRAAVDPPAPARSTGTGCRRLFRQLAMFLAAVIGWVFFRATSFEMALRAAA